MENIEFARDFARFYNSIKVNEDIEQDVDFIYHYTSPEGLSGIVQNKKLRFTDRFYLNDKSEGTYILNLCIDNIVSFEPISEEFKNRLQKACELRLEKPQRNNFFVYQCSFSMDTDNLSLWNYYTKSDSIEGYNVKFDATDLMSFILPELRGEHTSLGLLYGKVIYDKSNQLEILKKIVLKFYEFSQTVSELHTPLICQYLVDKIMQLGIFFKMPFFNVENEFRLALDLYLNEDGTYAVISDEQSFYTKKGIFIPYIDLEFNSNMLAGVGVSPTLNFESSRESILRMAGDKYPKLKKDTVYSSVIPLRY